MTDTNLDRAAQLAEKDAKLVEAARTDRLCDHIAGMDYINTCYFCSGDGEYTQTYTAGCGGGYFRMKGPCDHCGGTGIRTTDGARVSPSVLAQIQSRRAALAKHGLKLERIEHE